MSKLDDIRGQGIDDPMIAVENITLNKEEINVVGQKMDTMQFKINDIPCVMFRCDEQNKIYDWIMNDFSDEGTVTFELVGTAQTNIFNGIRQYQIAVDDINVLSITTDEELDEDIWD